MLFVIKTSRCVTNLVHFAMGQLPPCSGKSHSLSASTGQTTAGRLLTPVFKDEVCATRITVLDLVTRPTRRLFNRIMNAISRASSAGHRRLVQARRVSVRLLHRFRGSATELLHETDVLFISASPARRKPRTVGNLHRRSGAVTVLGDHARCYRRTPRRTVRAFTDKPD
jgi:hypothetical protein